ncbi:MAG: EF-Tu/IF-2/RF-3 family GTPase [Ruminococcus sp.]
MGFFDFLKKPKTDVELYYEEREKQEKNVSSFCNFGENVGFRLTVQDVFSISGRGTVVTGNVECGTVKVGDVLTLQRIDGTSREVSVMGIALLRKMVNTASAGDNVGILLGEIGKNQVGEKDILIK